MSKIPVTVLIPIKNEAVNLPRCLAALSWAAEVIVVDSYSTDGSQKIAESFGASVVQFAYTPPWPKKKQWALETLCFKNNWVFLLDADEVLSPNTPEALSEVMADPKSTSGYWIDRRFYFLEQPLKHAYTPNWNLRFFRKGSCRFEKLTTVESNSGDNEVHEHLICSGTTAKLRGLVMDHYAFPTVESFLEKHLRYASWEAAVELYPMQGDAKLSLTVAVRRFIKKLSRGLPFRPFLRFCWVYFFQKAWMDGEAGFHFARLHGIYEVLISIKKHQHLQKYNLQNKN